MRFLAPAGVVAVLAVPAIVFLYFLRVRRPEVSVANLLFWSSHIADRQANAPWQRLRPGVLLFLQLAVAATLAMSLVRPAVAGSTGVAATTVVLIDASPTMQATDVEPSRFEVAVDVARRLGTQLGPGQKLAVILLGERPLVLTTPTRDPAVLRQAFKRARPSPRAGDLGEGLSVAESLLTGRPGGSVVLVSDGHFQPPRSTPRLSGPLTYWSVGATGENVGLEALGRQPDGTVFVRAVNMGRERRELEVELRADGRVVDVLPLALDGNGSAETTWNRLGAGTRVVEARLRPGDALPLDDVAWLVTEPPERRRALIVTPGNGFLERALRLRDDLDVTVVTPEQYRPGSYDLHVFDRFVPPGELPEPALVIAPPQGTGPLKSGKLGDPGHLLPTNPREPLLRYVSLRDVHVQESARIIPLPGWETVIAGADGPLLLVRQGDARLAQLTFDLHKSDLPLRPAFPVLMQNLVAYLLPGGFENQVFPLGEPVRLATAADATAVEVTAPDGTVHRLAPPYPPTFAETSLPGVYSVNEDTPAGPATSRFVVQLPVPDGSRIAPGAGPEVESELRQPLPVSEEKGTRELWPWLVALVVAGLLAEWLVFLRG